jgi:Arc/MetJ-type ribon-helix-helix transcriptional regulator
MEQITMWLPEDLLTDLKTEAKKEDVSRSEYIRDALRTREDTERLRERLESRENWIDELERQLAERSQIDTVGCKSVKNPRPPGSRIS